jgi:hypothetical protein
MSIYFGLPSPNSSILLSRFSGIDLFFSELYRFVNLCGLSDKSFIKNKEICYRSELIYIFNIMEGASVISFSKINIKLIQTE